MHLNTLATSAIGRVLTGLSLAALVAISPPALSAEPTERELARAEKAYEQGVRFIRARRIKRAQESFEKALPYKNQSSDIFFNLVQTTEKNRHWAKLYHYASGFLYFEKETKDAGIIQKQQAIAAKRLKKRLGAPVTIVFDFGDNPFEAYVDDVLLSENRVTEVTLLPGTYKLRVKRYDHHDHEATLVVEKDTPTTVKGELKKIVYNGKLKVATTPPAGVQVFIDDKQVGVTPIKKPFELPTLRYLVRFEKPGFDSWSRYVTVEREQTTELSATLERSPVGTAEKAKAKAEAKPAPGK